MTITNSRNPQEIDSFKKHKETPSSGKKTFIFIGIGLLAFLLIILLILSYLRYISLLFALGLLFGIILIFGIIGGIVLLVRKIKPNPYDSGGNILPVIDMEQAKRMAKEFVQNEYCDYLELREDGVSNIGQSTIYRQHGVGKETYDEYDVLINMQFPKTHRRVLRNETIAEVKKAMKDISLGITQQPQPFARLPEERQELSSQKYRTLEEPEGI